MQQFCLLVFIGKECLYEYIIKNALVFSIRSSIIVKRFSKGIAVANVQCVVMCSSDLKGCSRKILAIPVDKTLNIYGHRARSLIPNLLQ